LHHHLELVQATNEELLAARSEEVRKRFGALLRRNFETVAVEPSRRDAVVDDILKCEGCARRVVLHDREGEVERVAGRLAEKVGVTNP
jgi:hypothetical protein